jgi:hypothetical protein
MNPQLLPALDCPAIAKALEITNLRNTHAHTHALYTCPQVLVEVQCDLESSWSLSYFWKKEKMRESCTTFVFCYAGSNEQKMLLGHIWESRSKKERPQEEEEEFKEAFTVSSALSRFTFWNLFGVFVSRSFSSKETIEFYPLFFFFSFFWGWQTTYHTHYY